MRNWLSTYTDSLLRAFILIASLVIGFGANHWLHLSAQSNIATIFVSAAAMIGGVTAIVFTLSVFAQQNAANLYSSEFFQVYTHDRIEKLTYVLTVCIILIIFGVSIFFLSDSPTTLLGFSVGGFYFSYLALGVYATLFCIGSVFVLIDIQYKNVRRKTDPLRAIAFLEKHSLRLLKRMHKHALKIAKVMLAQDDKITEELAIATSYNSFLQAPLWEVDRQIEYLFQISAKLADRHEAIAANRGLTAVHNILKEYLQLRSSSSIAQPSSINFLAVESDSQKFLSSTFERLNNIGEKFIIEKKIDNARHITDIYTAFAVISKDIKYIRKDNDNPIFDQVRGYLSFYNSFAIREKDREMVFKNVQAFNTIAAAAIEQGLLLSLRGMQDDINAIARFGITEKQLFITDECQKIWLSMLAWFFTEKFYAMDYQLDDVFNDIANTALTIHQAINLGLIANDTTAKFSIAKAYDSMMVSISTIMTRYQTLDDEEDKKFYRAQLVKLFEHLNTSLRLLSEKLKSADSTLVYSIGNVISGVNELMVRMLISIEFQDIHSDLISRLGWNIHLPAWFAHHAEKINTNNAFNNLVESVARTGVLLFDLEDRAQVRDIIIDCVEALYSLNKHVLNKSTDSDYDTPRIMLKICYLGVLALKYNEQEILTEAGVRIYEFEEVYKKKIQAIFATTLPPHIDPDSVYGVPKEDQLYLEVLRWRDELVSDQLNHRRILDNTKELIQERIEEIDIDRFMLEVWHSFPADSAVGKEFEEQLQARAKQLAIQKLIRVLIKVTKKQENES